MRIPYLLSFTSSSLLRPQSALVAECVLAQGSWDKAREVALMGNLLQARAKGAGERWLREIRARLNPMPNKALEWLANGTVPMQNQVLWVAVCARYRIIFEFAQEVVREKYLRRDLQLAYPDFDWFYQRKAEWSPELQQVTPMSQSKMRQVLFRMLRECELLDSRDQIQALLPDRQLVADLGQAYKPYWAAFTAPDAYLQEICA